MSDPVFRALVVNEVAEKEFASVIQERKISDLPEGDVLIRVCYSSLNYKDALSANGNKGVTRKYPHTPGIDAAGIVVSCANANFSEGEEVIVIGYDLGMNTAGGFGQYIRVPSSWVVACPEGLTLRQAMVLGTAGFTAALCIEKLLANGLTPEDGEVLVTGGTGGVGIVAVALLAKMGFEVIASTGKDGEKAFLQKLGAKGVVDRSEYSEGTSQPMLKERWSGAVDVVGGDTLFNILKSLKYGASVAACGLVQSPMFQASVLPFILRGVNLLGVDSVVLPLETKKKVWSLLASDWKIVDLDKIAKEIHLEDLNDSLQQVKKGQAVGRFLLNLNNQTL